MLWISALVLCCAADTVELIDGFQIDCTITKVTHDSVYLRPTTAELEIAYPVTLIKRTARNGVIRAYRADGSAIVVEDPAAGVPHPRLARPTATTFPEQPSTEAISSTSLAGSAPVRGYELGIYGTNFELAENDYLAEVLHESRARVTFRENPFPSPAPNFVVGYTLLGFGATLLAASMVGISLTRDGLGIGVISGYMGVVAIGITVTSGAILSRGITRKRAYQRYEERFK